MIVEHSFVTTLEAPDAMRVATDFLQECGFTAEAQGAFQVNDQGWKTLQFRRGKRKPSQARAFAELPQQLSLEWDRGKVDMAASILPGRRETRGSFGSASRTDSLKLVLHRDHLIALAASMELLLSQQVPQEARSTLAQLAPRIAAKDKSDRRGRIAKLALVILFLVVVAGAISIAVFAPKHR